MQNGLVPSFRSALSGRPLLADRVDRDLFVGRTDELRRAERALADRLNCVVTGDPGAGRTSLLHRIVGDFDDRQPLVRGSAATDAAHLLDLIIAGCRTLEPTDTATASGTDTGTGPNDVIDRIRVLAELLEHRNRTVIAIDDVPPAAGMELFGRHRDELWTVPATWFVTISSAQATALLRPPADVFFDIRIDLPALTPTTSKSLLRRRIGAGTESVGEPELDRVIVAAQGNPRRLIELTRRYSDTDRGTAGSAVDAIRERDGRLAKMSTPARMLAAELEALGGASASDPILLRRLGWTRSRAVQVFKELAATGLVTAVDERSGPGRPRKIYRLAESTPGRLPASDPSATLGTS